MNTMIGRTFASLALLVAALSGCGDTSMAHQVDLRSVTRIFGPVIPQDVIRGRERDGNTLLLLVATNIIRLDLGARRASSVAIAVPAGVTCWGLARLVDGTLWSIRGRSALIRIEPDGQVSREFALPEPRLGLFAAGDRLVYQAAVSTPPAPALTAGLPGEAGTHRWGDMTTRSFPGIARAQSAALNMVACGDSAGAEKPCWFPHEAVVSLIGPQGQTRRLALTGLAEVTPEVLLTAENPARPIRDAFVDRRGRIWILSTGVPPPGSPELPGGWILARYAADGSAEGQVRLADPVRLIVGVMDDGVVVVTGDGYVGEVKPW